MAVVVLVPLQLMAGEMFPTCVCGLCIEVEEKGQGFGVVEVLWVNQWPICGTSWLGYRDRYESKLAEDT